MFTSPIFSRTGRFMRGIAAASMLVFAVTHLPLAPAAAEMIGTDRAVGATTAEQAAPRAAAEQARGTIRDFIARDQVRAQLERFGVDPAEARERIAALNDAEAQRLAERIETAPAGAGVGAVIGFAALIFVVLLITDLLGFTSVFPFTNKGSANPA